MGITVAFVVTVAAKHAQIADVIRATTFQRHDVVYLKVDDASAFHALRLVVAQLLRQA